MIPDDVRERWLEALAASQARDEFLAVLTIWVAVGAFVPRG